MAYQLKIWQRIFITYPLLGLILSIIVMVSFDVSFNLMEGQYMDNFLLEELEHFIEFNRKNPQVMDRRSRSWQIYKITSDHQMEALRFLSAYAPGTYDIEFQGRPYDVGIIERDGSRFYILYNDQRYESLQASLITFMAAITFVIIWAATTYGLWFSKRVLKPVLSLAAEVKSHDIAETELINIDNYASDEIGFLAAEFNNYHRRIKKLLEREREFTANASHELRTPLAVVKAATEALQLRSNLPVDIKSRLDRIERAVNEMTQRLQVLLILAREPGSKPSMEDVTNVTKMLIHLLEDFEPLRPPEVAIIQHYLARPVLDVPAAMLSIVLSNVLTNAFRNTRAGSISIEVDEQQVKIADTGRGISQDQLQNIIKRGYKAHDSQGEGLGLSLVQRICDFCQWQLLIDSHRGKGTVVRLVFGKTADDAGP